MTKTTENGFYVKLKWVLCKNITALLGQHQTRLKGISFQGFQIFIQFATCSISHKCNATFHFIQTEFGRFISEISNRANTVHRLFVSW